MHMCSNCKHNHYCMGAFTKDVWCGNHESKYDEVRRYSSRREENKEDKRVYPLSEVLHLQRDAERNKKLPTI